MSLTTRVLIGLLAGLAAGIGISAAGSPTLLRLVPVVEPVGTLWVNAIRMTVVPLVFSLLVAGVAGGGAGTVARLGGRALLLFLAMLTVAAGAATLAARPLFALLSIDPAVSASLREAAARGAATAVEGAGRLPGFAEWLTGLVPVNPVRAAADGAMLPLIVFAVALGVALTRVAPASRDALAGVLRAVADAMLVLVQWILALAPVGVFALALPLATRMGTAAAGALAYYVAVAASLSVAVSLLVLYPAAVALGRVPLRDFARAALPGQAVALSARSSLAALPALIEEGERRLRFPPGVLGFFLPLSASVFRVGSAVGLPVGVLFVARLYGVELGAGALLTVTVVSVLLTFSVPGVPGGSIFIMAPVLVAAGLPVEGLGILLGADTIPDMVRTASNVTGHMAVGSILARGGGYSSESPAAQ